MGAVGLEAALDPVAAVEGLKQMLEVAVVARERRDRPCRAVVLPVFDADGLHAAVANDEVVLVPLAHHLALLPARQGREQPRRRAAVLEQVAVCRHRPIVLSGIIPERKCLHGRHPAASPGAVQQRQVMRGVGARSSGTLRGCRARFTSQPSAPAGPGRSRYAAVRSAAARPTRWSMATCWPQNARSALITTDHSRNGVEREGVDYQPLPVIRSSRCCSALTPSRRYYI